MRSFRGNALEIPIPKKNISESETLNTLIQVYLSHTSKWYSSAIAVLIGSMGIPFFVFNLQKSSSHSLSNLYLHIFTLITLSLLLATLYFLHKVIYSLQFLEELYNKLEMRDSGKSLNDYRNELMQQLKLKLWIYKFLVKREKDNTEKEYKLHNLFFVASFIFAFVGGLMLLSIIWVPFTENLTFFLIWGVAYLILIIIYLLKKII